MRSKLVLPLLAALPVALALTTGCSDKKPPAPDACPPVATPLPSASAALSAAANPPPAPLRAPVREGSAIARSPAGDALYIADEDHAALRILPLPLPATGDPAIKVIAMPGAPAQVLPLADRVLVTIRDPGLLLVLRPDPAAGLVEAARVPLPADAWGLAVTPDEAIALVTSAWTHQLSAIDLAHAEKRWSLDLPREPRAVVVRPDGLSAYVTHLVGAAITRVDGLAGSPTIHALELPPAPARAPSGKTLDATLAYAAVLDEHGSRLFVPRHALGALGQGSWYGATTVDVLATARDTPVLPKRYPGLPQAKHPVLTQLLEAGLVTGLETSAAEATPVIQPRAVAYRKSTRTLLVAGEGDDRIAELDALAAAPALRPIAVYKVGKRRHPSINIADTCAAPSGLALSADEATAYVFCRASDDVVAVKLSDPGAAPPPGRIIPGIGRTPDVPAEITASVHLADDLLGKDEALGRRLFYNATDTMVSGGLGCAGCHPEGRDDGHVWHEAKVTSLNDTERTIFIAEPELAPNAHGNTIGYARQTPMLAGRVNADGPYGWHAQNANLVERLKEGFSLHRWSGTYRRVEGEELARIHAIRAFVRAGLVTPKRPEGELTEEQKRGEAIFKSDAARCSKCHVPESSYTDRTAYPFAPKLPPPEGYEDDPVTEYKTPSLRFVGGTPPYFHDGRYRSLEQLFEENHDRMGKTSALSREERAALIAFLRTL